MDPKDKSYNLRQLRGAFIAGRKAAEAGKAPPVPDRKVMRTVDALMDHFRTHGMKAVHETPGLAAQPSYWTTSLIVDLKGSRGEAAVHEMFDALEEKAETEFGEFGGWMMAALEYRIAAVMDWPL